MSEPTLAECIAFLERVEQGTLKPNVAEDVHAILAHLRSVPTLTAERDGALARAEAAEATLERIAECTRYTRAGGATEGDLGSYEAGLEEAIELALSALPDLTPGGPDAD